MKKITLLTLLFVCAVTFGQQRVSELGPNNPVSIQKKQATLENLQNRSAENQTIIAMPATQDANILGANNPVSFQKKYASLTNVQNRTASNETINTVSAEQKVTSFGANNPVVFQKRPSHSGKKGQQIELPQRNTNPADREINLLGNDNPVYYGPQGKSSLSTLLNNFGSGNEVNSSNQGAGNRFAPCTEENPNDFTFENGLNCSSASAFQTANDVTVAADEDFELSQITASIFANGGIASVDVIYYDNAGGLPGAVIGSELGLVPTSQVVIGSNFGFDVNEIVLDLTPFTFAGTAGVPTTYWTELSVTDGGGTGSVFWVVTSSTSVGNPTALFNGAWAYFDPALDGVYIWGGDCIPFGGGGGGPCAEENPNDFTFENGLNCSSASAFQTANDVTVAADEDFELDQITASIFANGGIALVDVIYYDDAGGLPGAVIGSEAGIVPTSQVVIGSNFGFDVNEIVLDLTPFTFAGTAGVPTTYWTELSVTDGGGTGSVFWVVTSSSAVGNPTALFNGAWAYFDPALDGVYIWGGTCTPFGGGGGGPCAEENPNDFTFENGLNCSSASAFQTANDVTVAADEDFEIDQITASIFANGGIALVDVIYYDDAGGLPGAVIGSEAGIVPTSQVVIGSNFGFDVNEIVLDLTPFTFAGTAGVPTTYWTELSVTDGGGTGSVFWVVTSSSAVGNPTALFNGAWAYFDPALDGVYIWSGTCTPFGGGPGCAEENPNDFTFENGLNCSSASAFQTANDVTVADGEDFEINQITASIFANGGIALVDVIYYDDAGGLPGAVIGSESGIVPTSQVVIGSNFGFDVNEIVLDLTPFTFAGQNGSTTTYWTELSVTDGGGTGSVFWVVTSSSAVGNPTALFNGSWAIFDPVFDGVYIWSGECTPLAPDPTYDTCDGALPISCGEIAAGSTIGATVDSAVAPTCDTSVTAPGVWYVYQDTTGLVTDITITTCNGTTDYDAKLSVYTGDCGSPPLTCVVGNDDTCGLQPEVSFQSDGATTFYILVHGFASNVGNFEIEMICTPVPPPNDMIANSIDVDEIGFPYTDPSVAMPAATTEAGTPADCDNAGVKGVWYNFVPTGDGDATASITTPGGGLMFTVNNGPLAGNYPAVAAAFGGAFTSTPITEDTAVVIDDNSGGGTDPNDACEPIINGPDLNGKIAIIRRGACAFTGKVLAAQNEGAIAVIMVNNVAGDPIIMGGTEPLVTIPALMLSDVNGEAIIAEVSGGGTVNVTMVEEPAAFSSVTFYTAPNENAVETDLTLVPWFENQCVPGIQATIPTVAGQAYYVYVSNPGAITDIVIDGTNLGVESNTIEGFTYYPNPTSSTLNLSSVENIENVEIYNMLGQKVIDLNVNATTSEIGVSGLSTGTYIMKVSVNGQIGTYKILKQ